MRLIGFICCYNERDIIGDTLSFYERMGVPVVFIDNGSTDGSDAIARFYLGTEILEYVSHKTDEYDLRSMLNLCLTVLERHRPDWIMHIDADHLYEPGTGFKTYRDHIADAEAMDCNVIDFDEYVFFPTTADDPNTIQIYERMKHYAFRAPGKASGRTLSAERLLQPRIYRYVPGMDIGADGGHTISYPTAPMRVHPIRGILRHYMFRSPEQGRRKLSERRSRYSLAGKSRGWHRQYDNWSDADGVFQRRPEDLCRRVEGLPWSQDVLLGPDGSVHRVGR